MHQGRGVLIEITCVLVSVHGYDDNAHERQTEYDVAMAHLQIIKGKYPEPTISDSRHPKLKIVVRKIHSGAGIEGVGIGSNHNLACIVGLRKYSLM